MRQSNAIHNKYDVIVFFFFFFQAEDGIRDVAVTGVQTCALPIWASMPTPLGQPLHGIRFFLSSGQDASWMTYLQLVNIRHGISRLRFVEESLRSEERRVGKECRSRWSPYH